MFTCDVVECTPLKAGSSFGGVLCVHTAKPKVIQLHSRGTLSHSE